jgi:hypothetical protein
MIPKQDDSIILTGSFIHNMKKMLPRGRGREVKVEK